MADIIVDYNHTSNSAYVNKGKVTYTISYSTSGTTTTATVTVTVYIYPDSYTSTWYANDALYIGYGESASSIKSEWNISPTTSDGTIDNGKWNTVGSKSFTVQYTGTSAKTIYLFVRYTNNLSSRIAPFTLPKSHPNLSTTYNSYTYTSGSSNAITLAKQINYTACTAPTTVYLGSTSSNTNTSQYYALTGTTAYLRWSGAAAGTSNSIVGYTIYSATSTSTSSMTKVADVSSTATSGSYSITVSGSSTLYYRIVTRGSAGSSYYSGYSSTYRVLTPCTKPKASINTTAISAYPGDTVTLTGISTTDGTNNAVSSITLYRDGSSFKTGIAKGTTTYSVTAHSTVGSSYKFSVQAIGAKFNSDVSSQVTVTTIARPTQVGAPTTIYLGESSSNTNTSNLYSLVGTTVYLRWSGATAGVSNNISGYEVAGGTSSSPTTALTTTTSTSYSFSVPNSSSTYYYRVRTKGTVSISGSLYSAYTTTRSLIPCTRPTASINTTSIYARPSTSVNLTGISASNGTNNAASSITLYRNGSSFKTGLATNVGTYAVISHATVGSSYYYSVIAIGAKFNSTESSKVYVYTYENVVPTISSSTTLYLLIGGSSNMTWTANSGGSYNALSKYEIYRGTTSSAVSTLINTINTTTLSGSYSVSPHATLNSDYFYLVKAVAARSYNVSGIVTVHNYQKPEVSISPTSNLYILSGTNGTLKGNITKAGGTYNKSYIALYKGSTQSAKSTSQYASTGSYDFTITPPAATSGTYDTYKVIALGDRLNSDYTSEVKVYAYTNPTVTNIKIDNESSNIYRYVYQSFNITWDSSNGINTGYNKFTVNGISSSGIGVDYNKYLNNVSISTPGMINITVLATSGYNGTDSGSSGYRTNISSTLSNVNILDYSPPTTIKVNGIVPPNNQVNIPKSSATGNFTLSWEDTNTLKFTQYKIYQSGSLIYTVNSPTSSKTIAYPSTIGTYNYYIVGYGVTGNGTYSKQSITVSITIYDDNIQSYKKINARFGYNIVSEASSDSADNTAPIPTMYIDSAVTGIDRYVYIEYIDGAASTTIDFDKNQYNLIGAKIYRRVKLPDGSISDYQLATGESIISLYPSNNYRFSTNLRQLANGFRDLPMWGSTYYYSVSILVQDKNTSQYIESSKSPEVGIRRSLFRYVYANGAWREVIERYVYTNGEWHEITQRAVFAPGRTGDLHMIYDKYGD